MVADQKANVLLAIRRINMQKRNVKAKLEFDVPSRPGAHNLSISFICDSYLGCDQVLYCCFLWLLVGHCRVPSI